MKHRRHTDTDTAAAQWTLCGVVVARTDTVPRDAPTTTHVCPTCTAERAWLDSHPTHRAAVASPSSTLRDMLDALVAQVEASGLRGSLDTLAAMPPTELRARARLAALMGAHCGLASPQVLEAAAHHAATLPTREEQS